MANFKRNKPKQRVRCTMCTTYRWLGNNSGRAKYTLSKHRDRQKVLNLIKQDADLAQR